MRSGSGAACSGSRSRRGWATRRRSSRPAATTTTSGSTPGSRRAARRRRVARPASSTSPCATRIARRWPTRCAAVLAAGIPLDGASDHGVSEAIYLRDPDGERRRAVLRPAARGMAAHPRRRDRDGHLAARPRSSAPRRARSRAATLNVMSARPDQRPPAGNARAPRAGERLAASRSSLARLDTGDAYDYGWLVWNLFLAWLPFVLRARALRRLPARPSARCTSASFGALWLLFLPNAPYILTDFVHLRRAGSRPALVRRADRSRRSPSPGSCSGSGRCSSCRR